MDTEGGCVDVSLLDCIYCPAYTKQGETMRLALSLRQPDLVKCA